MKFRILSDVHAEFHQYRPYELSVMAAEPDTVLLLAGDLGVTGQPWTYDDTIIEWCNRFKAVCYIPGNHEYYNTSLLRCVPKIKQSIERKNGGSLPANLFFDDKFAVTFDGVRVICTTLWTDMNKHDPGCMLDARLTMNDYRIIRTGTVGDPYCYKLRPSHTVAQFNTMKAFINDELQGARHSGLKSIVMTHHAPSFQSISPHYVDSSVNGAYASELYSAYDDNPMPNVHIHGHVHDSFDYMLDQTRVICNPRGYYPSDLNRNFDPELVIEL